MSRLEGFDFENQRNFLAPYCKSGSRGRDPKTFKSKLTSKNISTEAFKFEGATPPPAEYRRVVTNEGLLSYLVLGMKKQERRDKTEGMEALK